MRWLRPRAPSKERYIRAPSDPLDRNLKGRSRSLRAADRAARGALLRWRSSGRTVIHFKCYMTLRPLHIFSRLFSRRDAPKAKADAFKCFMRWRCPRAPSKERYIRAPSDPLDRNLPGRSRSLRAADRAARGALLRWHSSGRTGIHFNCLMTLRPLHIFSRLFSRRGAPVAKADAFKGLCDGVALALPARSAISALLPILWIKICRAARAPFGPQTALRAVP